MSKITLEEILRELFSNYSLADGFLEELTEIIDKGGYQDEIIRDMLSKLNMLNILGIDAIKV